MNHVEKSHVKINESCGGGIAGETCEMCEITILKKKKKTIHMEKKHESCGGNHVRKE